MNTEAQDPTRQTEQAGPPLPLFGREDRIPERIGRFRIIDVIAKGMALVYKAEQDHPRRIVALKIPRGGKLLSAETRERFLREVQFAANLEHAGIVPVLEAGEIDGVPFYTMPYIEGRSLTQHIDMENPPAADRVGLFLRLCDVVQSLHAAGLVHRDLKPDNVLVDRHGSVRLLDFGLAKAVHPGEARLTMDNGLLGTPAFMAPEQTQPGAAGDVTAATDVYALGMILYWMLTGTLPYRAEGSRETVLRTIREARPRPPSASESRIKHAGHPALFDAVVLAALSKKPKDRPPDAGALARRLREALSGPPLPAHPRARRIVPLAVVLTGVAAAGALVGPALHRKAPARGMPAGHETAPPTASEAAPSRAHDEAPWGAAAKADVFPPEQVASLSGGRASLEQPEIDARQDLPAEIRPLYSQALAALREDFAHRRDGAIILLVAPGSSPGEVTWQIGNQDRLSRPVTPGSVVLLYAPDGETVGIDLTVEGKTRSRSVRVRMGEVVFLP